jgi:hypothetical protein
MGHAINNFFPDLLRGAEMVQEAAYKFLKFGVDKKK